MCGITGIYAYKQLEQKQLEHLEQATKALALRGPDSHQLWNNNKVGLGHRRLSIIDTSEKGLQPMLDASGKYVISYNGELYNYRDIRKDLIDKGYQFNSETDTEVVLNAYIEWGNECLTRFNGFFAFAILSIEENSLFVARDRFGIKPLVYVQQDQFFAFASELKSLQCYDWAKELDRQAVNLFFQLTYIPAPLSIFSGVKKLEPGHFLEFKNGELKKRQYYEVPYVETPVITDFEDAKKQVRSSLQRSVQRRLVSDVPLGSFLSGGIDSSIITALAASEVSHFKTFSIGFTENKFYDETAYAEMLAEKYYTDHQTFPLSNDDLFAHLEDITTYLDEPFADSSAIPSYILSKLTREHVTVALSGDGADEIFSGYNKHSAWQMSNERDRFNKVILALSPFLKKMPKSRGSSMGNFFRQLDKYVGILKLNQPDRYWRLASFGSEELRQGILNEDYFDDLQDFRNNFLESIESSDLNRVLHQDLKLVLQGDMLPKVDFMSMANSLEVRVPFLDHEVVATAFNIPTSMKINGNTRKYVLREAFKKDLPYDLYRRGKQGFEIPLLEWLRGPMQSELENLIFDRDRINDSKLFRWEGVEQLKNQLYSRHPGDAVIHVWQMFVFIKWMGRYFN